jgi:hypothetical protein
MTNETRKAKVAPERPPVKRAYTKPQVRSEPATDRGHAVAASPLCGNQATANKTVCGLF